MIHRFAELIKEKGFVETELAEQLGILS